MTVVDSTVPVEPHVRWPFRRRPRSAFGAGGDFQIATFATAVHASTLVDTRHHLVPDGAGAPARVLAHEGTP